MKRQPAKISYFFGPGYEELGNVIRGSWERNLISAEKYFYRPATADFWLWIWVQKCFFWGLGLNVMVFGTIFFIALSLIHTTILCLFFIAVYFLFAFAWILDYLYRTKEKIFAACPQCYKKSSLPEYQCSCGAIHTQLWPSKYGISKRTCNCGAKLPTTFFNGRGKLHSLCPYCHHDIKTENGTPLIIPIVGPPASGKTTFLYSLIENLDSEKFKAKGYKVHSNISQKQIKESITQLRQGQRVGKTIEGDKRAVDLIVSRGSMKYAVYFYDYAGEDLDASRKIEHHSFYSYFSAMIFMMDPFAIEEIRSEYFEQLKKHTQSLSHNPYTNAIRLDDVINTLTRTLAEHYGISDSAKIKQRLAVVIPKVDIIGENAFNTDKDCKAFLVKLGQRSFVNKIIWKFKHTRFFSVVSQGQNSVGITQPFEWILRGEIAKKRIRRFFSNLLMFFFIAFVVGALAVGGYYGFRGVSDYLSDRYAQSAATETDPTAVPEANYTVNASSLNIRSAASGNAPVVGKLTKGEDVYIYDVDSASGFAKMAYNGDIAYVSAKYLTPKEVSMPTASASRQKKVAKAGPKSGWSTFLLQGQVERVIYDDGKYIYFNTDGNVLKHNVRKSARGREEFEYVYSTPTRFVLKGDESFPYKIVINDNTREEIWDNSEALGLTFEYDNNRLIGISEPEYGFGISETYKYDGNNTYPSQRIIEYYDETGTQTDSHSYSGYEMDERGNWTKRTVERKVMETDHETEKTTETTSERFMESRKIYYF